MRGNNTTFLKQKFMRYNIWGLVLSVLMLFACNQHQSLQGTISQTPTINFSSQVKGCAAVSADDPTKFPVTREHEKSSALPDPVNSFIRSSGDSVVYSRFVHHGCCRKVKLNVERNGNIINIVEYWRGKICKCMCSSDISATVHQLPKGEYTVYAIETGTDPITDKLTIGKDTLMKKMVVIR
jgi:hypothetical protein